MVKVVLHCDNSYSFEEQCILILLEELDIKYDKCVIEENDKENTLNAERVSGQGTLDFTDELPMLEYGDIKLIGHRCILRYIARANREYLDLFPTDKVDMFMEIESQKFYPLSQTLPDSSSDLKKLLEKYNHVLESQSYIAGENFSIADITHIPIIYSLIKKNHKHLFKEYTNVYSWLKTIMRRPVVKQILHSN